MNLQVNKEVIKLRNKSDEEVIRIYTNLMTNTNQNILSALSIIINERNIELGNMTVTFSYINSKGIESFLKVAEL